MTATTDERPHTEEPWWADGPPGVRLHMRHGGSGDYWQRRRGLVYYYYVASFVCAFGRDASSVIDVGPNGTPLVDWFDWIPTRHTVDASAPYASETATGFKADFFSFEPPQRYDLALCLQVLEHVEEAAAFTRKLFAIADHVILSVPYLWDSGRVADHVHDPVDEAKLQMWTGRKPTHSVIAAEPLKAAARGRRLICYYAPKGQRVRLKEARLAMRALPQEALGR